MNRTSTMWIVVALLMAAAVVQAYLIIQSAYLAIIMSMAALFFMLFHNAPVGLLMILVFIFPISGTEAFKTAMADIPGFKPLQLLSLAVLAVAVLNIRHALRLPRSAAIFYGAMVLLFTITVLRSVPNLDSINPLLSEPLSLQRYFLSEYFKPLIYFIPAVIIGKYVYTTKDIDRVVQAINWSITILSILVIGFFFINRDLVMDPGSTRSYYAASFGLHTNTLGNYYILAFPFVLTDLFRKKYLIGAIRIFLCAVALALLFSRSAYFLFILSFFIYLFISKRGKWLPVVLAIMLTLSFLIPESVTQRATKGFETGDRKQIFAGRVDHIWLPLLKESTSDYKTLLFGNGRFAMVVTDAHKKKMVLQAMHPHNMYLEMLLDAGLVGLLIVLSLFAFLLKKAYFSLRNARPTHYKEYQIAVITSLICFLISGFTDRTFFPDEINGYLWILIAMAFVLCRFLQPVEENEVHHVQAV